MYNQTVKNLTLHTCDIDGRLSRHMTLGVGTCTRNCNQRWWVDDDGGGDDDDGVGGCGTQYRLAVLSLSEGSQLQIRNN